MGLRYVGGWVGACMCDVQNFDFGGLGRGGGQS